jgi:class 3 adenylate cyclase
MAAFISRKKSALICLGALCAATGIAVLLNYLLAGPLLGPWYDFLLSRRPAPPAAREILLIDTGDLIEPGDAAPLILTLAEMDAAGLVIQVPVLGLASGRNESEAEVRRRFDDEFTLLGRNIRNLFEAIRVGSVPPAESGRYVENLVELAERGKERLSAALVRRDEAGTRLMKQAAAAYGRVWQAGDLRLLNDAPALPEDSPWFSKPQADWDGKIRRISPVLLSQNAGGSGGPETEGTGEIEHVVYAGLKSRWGENPALAGEGEDSGGTSELEYGEEGPALPNRRLLLDREGRVLFEKTRPGEGFRRLSLDRFREYEEAGQALLVLLRDAEALGVYSQIPPERSPLFLYEYAGSLREDFLEKPGPETRAAWVQGQAGYFAALDELLAGPVETALVGGYEELIATERLKEEGLKRLQDLRDDLIRAFAGIREQYGKLLELRHSLEAALPASFCIMGPPEETEPSAALANTLLTGRFITPGFTRYVLFWSLLAAFLAVFVVFSLSPFRALFAGIVMTLLIAAGFSWSFIISGYWIDPLIPVAAALGGILTVFCVTLMLTRRGSRHFRLAYGPYVNKTCLKQLIRSGRPQPAGIIRTRAAIVALRNGDILAVEDKGDALVGARMAGKFRALAADMFKKTGAVIIGADGDMVLAAFGSPLERIALESLKSESAYKDDPLYRGPHSPAARAAGFILDLLTGNQDTKTWRFGIDTGECAFTWSNLGGYTAYGRPVVRARVLSNLAARYKTQVLITGSVSEGLRDIPARKLDVLTSHGGKEFFYELPVKY